MIKYALQCSAEHGFEGWFGSSAEYDRQAEAGLVACPYCATREVRKAVMAPAVAGTRKRDAAPTAPSSETLDAAMAAVREHIATTFDYVGDRFAREARDIHEGRSEARSIYGEATPHEAKALAADGVSVAPLPAAATPKPKTVLN